MKNRTRQHGNYTQGVNFQLQALQGEMRFIETFYRKHFAELLLTAYSIVENEAEAEDIVSDFVEKLLHLSERDDFLDAFKSENELLGFVRISVRNACYDILRKRKNRGGILRQIGSGLQFWKRPEAFDHFQSEAIELMLMELSEREKEIFTLHRQGYKQNEIANKLGLSEFTVRNTLFNARKRVRKIWNKFMH
jgi:RNA polymerase sigma-70 factor (ECF subfamily)